MFCYRRCFNISFIEILCFIDLIYIKCIDCAWFLSQKKYLFTIVYIKFNFLSENVMGVKECVANYFYYIKILNSNCTIMC